MEPVKIFPLPAFEDNYIWCLRAEGKLAVVDPGDATPVLQYLSESGDRLCAILVTHKHRDHIGGITELAARYPVAVYAPGAEAIPGTTHPVSGGGNIALPELGVEFEVLDFAGHTRGHVGYYRPGTLFCGDTLFGCGCGKLFEGTPAQLHTALQRIGVLPRLTFAYCAHEYTASGIRFARAVEPGNAEVDKRAIEVEQKRAAGQPTVPFTIEDELATNPFLRCREPDVVAAVALRLGRAPADELEVFAALRAWRDVF